jgi:hypothetical protein
MLPTALQIGISVYGYWSMTYGEIIMSIEAFNENERLRIREVASSNHQLANLIGLSVARIMNKDAEYPSLKEAFPNIFDDLIEKIEPVQQDWQVAKARLLQYAEANNKKER